MFPFYATNGVWKVVIISLIFWVLLALAIISTWVKVHDISEKQDEILKRLAKAEERPSMAVQQQRDTITCIRCLTKIPSNSAKCPQCGTIIKG